MCHRNKLGINLLNPAYQFVLNTLTYYPTKHIF